MQFTYRVPYRVVQYAVVTVEAIDRPHADSAMLSQMIRDGKDVAPEWEVVSEARKMPERDLGQYRCMPSGSCLLAPDTLIIASGVWFRSGDMWSSAHAACYQKRIAGLE